jgi:hypothetical protein
VQWKYVRILHVGPSVIVCFRDVVSGRYAYRIRRHPVAPLYADVSPGPKGKTWLTGWPDDASELLNLFFVWFESLRHIKT